MPISVRVDGCLSVSTVLVVIEKVLPLRWSAVDAETVTASVPFCASLEPLYILEVTKRRQ